MRFSQRHGYTPVRDVVQRKGMDEDLRTGLWNVLEFILWRGWRTTSRRYNADLDRMAHALWHSYFKRPTDTIPDSGRDIGKEVRTYFFTCEWFGVYDLLEFIAQHYPEVRKSETLTSACNAILEQEVSAYRFVGGKVVEITSDEEIDAIEQALADTGSLGVVQTHLRDALDKLADRDSPDYRNSIKESISAVEALVNQIEGNRATLGGALKKLGVDAHPALRTAFSKLYGYTSDADGIRHALMEEPDLRFEDAKFMLVSCSAFVNYLRAKAARTSVAA